MQKDPQEFVVHILINNLFFKVSYHFSLRFSQSVYQWGISLKEFLINLSRKHQFDWRLILKWKKILIKNISNLFLLALQLDRPRQMKIMKPISELFFCRVRLIQKYLSPFLSIAFVPFVYDKRFNSLKEKENLFICVPLLSYIHIAILYISIR